MRHRVLWLIAGILGIGILVSLVGGGGLMALLALLSSFIGQAPDAASLLQTAGLAALGVVLGIPLAIQGWSGWRERPSQPFAPSRTWWVWLALVPIFFLLVALGAAVSFLLPQSLALWILPLIHAPTMCIPPLLALGIVGWGLQEVGGPRREIVTGMTSGGCLGMTLSLIGEILVFMVVVVVIAIVVVAIPGGLEQVMEWSRRMQDPASPADVTLLTDLMLSPIVIASVLSIFCIPVPIIEEIAKTLAGGVVGGWARPHPARAFAWGVAAGAGFALAENLFNGAVGGVEGWVMGAVTRIGTTTMHCFASGLVGWGWGQLWRSRRPLRLLGTLAAAMTIHGVWNAAAVGVTFAGIALMAAGGNIFQAGLVGPLLLLCVATLIGLTLTFAIALPLVARRLAAQEEHSKPGAIIIEEPSAQA
jgi:hypothetical protein